MTTFLRLVTECEADTEAAGRRLGAALRRGDLVGLDGEVGAGKTALVRGVAAGLGLDPTQVRSPTFALHHLYRGAPTLHHLDCYRLGPGAGLDVLELEALLEDGVVAMEWADYADLRAYSPVRMRMDALGPERRLLRLEPGAPGRVADAMRGAGASW